jgi:peptide/nickel transport system substrate-binding protein
MSHHRIASSLALIALAASILLAGCRPAAPATAPPTNVAPAGPRRGGALTVAIAADPDGLDPHKTVAAASFQITRNIYDTLVQTDERGRIEPDLALEWEPSADGKTWTFTLRTGVRFHNGRELTADDVVYSFERLLSPETASPRAKDFAVVESVSAPDAETVVFQLKQPQASFLSNLAYGWAAIVPREAADTLRDEPVGTGPFQLVEWVKDSHVTLERFDGYFLPGVPYLDRATFRVITDPAARMAALQAGEVDVIPELPVQQVATVRNDPALKLIEVPFNGIQYIAINNAMPPFDDVRVRQALNHAVDKQAVIEAAQFGIGVPIGSHMPPVTEFYVDLSDRYPYDPEKARALLAEAGYPDGFETTMILPQPYDFHIRNGQVVADQLSKVGIKVKLETMEWGTWLQQVYNGRQFALTAIGATGRLDPDPFLNAYVSTSPENMRNYENPRFDELAALGTTESETTRRKDIYAEMQNLLADDAAAIYLLAPLSSVTLRQDVQGWVVYPIDIYDLRTVWREDG